MSVFFFLHARACANFYEMLTSAQPFALATRRYMDSSGIERYLLKNPEDQQWWCTIDPTVLCFSDLEGNVSAPTLVLASSLAAGRKRSVQGSRSLGSLGSAGSHGRRGLPVIEAVVVTDGVPQALGQRQQSGLSNSSGGSSWREPSGSIASDTSDDGDDDGGGGGGDGDMNGTSQSYFRFSAAHPVEVVKVNRTGLWKSDVSSRSILPQQSAGVNTSHLKAVRGTTVGSSGWYTDIRTGSTNFYIVQDGRPHTHDFNFSGRVWMVVSKADLQTSDWALLLSQAVLVTVDGTRRGSRGAYRTFCFPAFRGEARGGHAHPLMKEPNQPCSETVYCCFTFRSNCGAHAVTRQACGRLVARNDSLGRNRYQKPKLQLRPTLELVLDAEEFRLSDATAPPLEKGLLS